MLYKVKNGNRIYEFDGKLLASSTSKKPDSYRWVEFNLYLTVGGSYILERIGQTDYFHHIECEVVGRNNLKFNPEDHLEDRHVPCEICDPDDFDDIVLEKPRYFALVSEYPAAILEALHKKADDGARYMTYVTQRLIEDAAVHDKRLEKAYRVEHIA